MTVDKESQMVTNKILTRNVDIERVKVFKLISELVELLLWNISLGVVLVKEDIVPDFASDFFRLKTKKTRNLTVKSPWRRWATAWKAM